MSRAFASEAAPHGEIAPNPLRPKGRWRWYHGWVPGIEGTTRAMTYSRAAAILLALSCAVTASAQIFPDKNLEEAVRRYVFEKRNTEEPITAEDVATISTITARDKGIQDLTGLEHCKRLMLLELPGNKVSDLTPIAGLDLLQSLTLTDNEVEDISPLQGLKRLQYIELSGNRVSDISALEGLEAMNSAYLSGNQISDLTPVKGLSKLWTLDVAGNKVSDLGPVASLARLSSLILDDNAVQDVSPLTGLKSLQRLSLRNNQVADIAPLAEMADADVAADSRFARYWAVSLEGNPLSQESAGKHLETLRKHSHRIEFGDQ